MDKYLKENLTKLREGKTTYDQMIDYCCDNCIMNNYIVEELQKKDIFFETYCGSECTYYNKDDEEITEEEYYKLENNEEFTGAYYEYDDIYQYYIISSYDAERLSNYTNELVIYNDDLDLYILCVKHWGAAWCGVPANWKEIEEEEEEE